MQRGLRPATPKRRGNAVACAGLAALLLALLASAASARIIFRPDDPVHHYDACSEDCTARSVVGLGGTAIAEYNHQTGYVATYAHATGFSTAAAEAVVRVTFYVESPRWIRYWAPIIRAGGAHGIGAAGFGGTYKVWRPDADGDRRTAEVDHWLNWRRISEIAVIIATSALGVTPGSTIGEAIGEMALSNAYANIETAFESALEEDYAEKLIVADEFYVDEPGMYAITVGLRSQASGVLWDQGEATSYGYVPEIRVWGIGQPDPPYVEGPTEGCPGAPYEFTVYNEDCLGDTSDYSYQFVWGDGTESPWTTWAPCGRVVTRSHTYAYSPTPYTLNIRVKTQADPDFVSLTTHTFQTTSPPLAEKADPVYAWQGRSCSQIGVTWRSVPGATAYHVYRYEPDAPDPLVYAGPLTSFIDMPPPLPPEVQPMRRYQVVAANGCDSTSSRWAYGWTLTAPDDPADITATDCDSCAVVLNWEPVVGDTLVHTSSALYYSLWRGPYGSDPDDAVLIGHSDSCTYCTRYVDEPPERNVQYRYWVRAHNPCGDSDFGVYDTGRAPPLPPPPGNVQATDGEYCTMVRVTWTDTSGPWYYYVLRDGVRISNARAEWFNDMTATPGPHTYTVEARPFCATDSLPSYSAFASDTGHRLFALAGPAAQATDGSPCDHVLVSWSPVAGADGYRVLRNGAELAIVGPGVVSHPDATAAPGTTYTYSVQSHNACGYGSAGAGDTGWRGQWLAAPVNFQASDGTSCSAVLLSWSAVAGAGSYRVTRDGTTIAVGLTATSTVDAAATPGVTHQYTVAALNVCGYGAAATDDGTRGVAMSPPANLQASDGTECGRVHVSWAAVPGASHYTLWRRAGALAEPAQIGDSITATATDDDAVEPGRAYQYMIKAHSTCDEAQSAWDVGFAHADDIALEDVLNDQGGWLRLIWEAFPVCPVDHTSLVSTYFVERLSGSEWDVIAQQSPQGPGPFTETVATTAIYRPGEPDPEPDQYRIRAAVSGVGDFTSAVVSGYSTDNMRVDVPAAMARADEPALASPALGGIAADSSYVFGDPATLEGRFETWSWVPSLQGWTPTDRSSSPKAGSFAQAWASLADLDPCRDNLSPQVAFIDDGSQHTGATGYSCQSWCYGPGGYVVNPEGGIGDPSSSRLRDWIVSPPIAWQTPYAGARLGFDIYCHEPLDPASAGLFFEWRVRSSEDGGLTWTAWRSDDLAYYGGPIDLRFERDVSALLAPARTHVQIALGVAEFGWIWGFAGTDATPAPYFDNVKLVACERVGPGLMARLGDLAQDAFPASGLLSYDPLESGVRFDMARDVAPLGALDRDRGDSLVVRVAPGRPGAVLDGAPWMHYAVRANPLYDGSFRSSGWPLRGVVLGDSCRDQDGDAVPDLWCFDLPDTGFLFPGDVVHYCFEARDDLGGDFALALLPSDTTGFSAFPGDGDYRLLRYPPAFTMRALPSIRDQYHSQPPVLLWLDGGGLETRAAWTYALDQAACAEGVDYDLYETRAPSWGLGNGLGGAATVAQLYGYQALLYDSDDERILTLSEGLAPLDCGPDLALIESWLGLGSRSLLLCGDNLALDLARTTAGQTLLGRAGVQLASENVGDLLNRTSPRAEATQPSAILSGDEAWPVLGGCPRRRVFNAVSGAEGALTLAAFDGAQGPDYAALLLNEDAWLGTRILFMPYGLQAIGTDASAVQPGGMMPTRAGLLQMVLSAFGVSGTSSPTGLPERGRLSVRSFPNPFNPSLRIEYHVPAAGRLDLRILNLRGQQVRNLLQQTVAAGAGHVAWDGTDDAGRAAASGVYFYEARMSGERAMGKLTLVR